MNKKSVKTFFEKYDLSKKSVKELASMFASRTNKCNSIHFELGAIAYDACVVKGVKGPAFADMVGRNKSTVSKHVKSFKWLHLHEIVETVAIESNIYSMSRIGEVITNKSYSDLFGKDGDLKDCKYSNLTAMQLLRMSDTEFDSLLERDSEESVNVTIKLIYNGVEYVGEKSEKAVLAFIKSLS